MHSLLELEEGQRLVVETAAKISQELIAPNAKTIDDTEDFPLSAIQELANHGLLGIPYPTTYGGMGLDFVTYYSALEEIAKACSSTAATLAAHTSLGGYPILRFGTEEQREKYLPRLARGEALGAFALTEKGAGSDFTAIETAAVRDGERYVLNGNKSLITNANYADLFIVAAKTAPTRGMLGISVFIVEKGTDGFRPSGKGEKKLGMRGSDTGDLVLDDVVIPIANRIERENLGLKVLLDTLAVDRIGTAAIAIGLAEAALAHCLRYVKERKQFGQAISQFQSIKNMLANMEVSISAARLLLREAAITKDRGADATRIASVAKLFASEAATQVTKDAVQIFGGWGCLQDYPVERLFRDAKLTEIVDGTSEIQRLIIADEVIKQHS
jgi:alkylation response protein AidB-like acyl-CoA dehydrogenase